MNGHRWSPGQPWRAHENWQKSTGRKWAAQDSNLRSTDYESIVLSVLGGISELVGVLTVVREIGHDRARAKRLFSTPREYVPPERRYPPRLGRHSLSRTEFHGDRDLPPI